MEKHLLFEFSVHIPELLLGGMKPTSQLYKKTLKFLALRALRD